MGPLCQQSATIGPMQHNAHYVTCVSEMDFNLLALLGGVGDGVN